MKNSLRMKSNISILFSIFGALVGYFSGSQADLDEWNLFWQIVAGSVLGLMLALSIFQRRQITWLGFAFGSILSILSNVFLKGELELYTVLFIVCITSYIGYCLHQKRRPIYIGGGIGGILGFLFGFYASFSIGELSYPPGFITAIAMAVFGSLLGMFVGTGFSYSLNSKE